MHEILRTAAPSDWVLDLASQHGSFPAGATPGRVIRLDLQARAEPGAFAVRADAARLPFRDGVFARVVANHCFEHFVELDAATREVARVMAPGAQLYVSVPDASALADRLYRWLARGGGHVNAFTSPRQLAQRMAIATGLPLAAQRLLHSGFTFANRRRAAGRAPRRLWLLGGGFPWMLRWATWLLRQSDRQLGTRLSVYGWALFFGDVHVDDLTAWTNVCIACGSGTPARALRGLRYRCPACGELNLFTPDSANTC